MENKKEREKILKRHSLPTDSDELLRILWKNREQSVAMAGVAMDLERFGVPDNLKIFAAMTHELCNATGVNTSIGFEGINSEADMVLYFQSCLKAIKRMRKNERESRTSQIDK